MQRISVTSSNVCSIGYKNGIIEVEFNDGSIYQYYGTTETLYRSFLNSSSKGRFVHYYLKRYRYQRIS